jgi:hypothetical protein
MNRAFTKGTVALDFPLPAFGSPLGLLVRSISLYLGNFFFIAWLTLLVFLPAKAALQAVCAVLDISTKGMLMYVLLSASDLALASLVTPAVVYALVERMRGGKLPTVGEALAWGRRQWGRTLWNRVKVEVTVSLSLLLLVIPGIVAAVRLALVDTVVAIEADLAPAPLARSRELAGGAGWRIFFVMLPLTVVELVGSYFILGAFTDPSYSRVAIAVVDSLLSVGGQLASAVALLMYLGVRKK